MLTLEGYGYSIPIEVRFSDLDALGHVNNAVYLTYMEQARLRYFRHIAVWDVNPTGVGLILAKATVDYKLPILLTDAIHVFIRVSRLGTKSMDTEYQIVREDGVVVATGLIVLVVYDYDTNTSAPIPAAWREKLIAFEPALQG